MERVQQHDVKFIVEELYNVVKDRKVNKEEGSYTCYLFEAGLDKILKKCGEETTEMVIAAKNSDDEELVNEMCDVLYHMIVLMVQQDVELNAVMDVLEERRKKISNLKPMHKSDKNT